MDVERTWEALDLEHRKNYDGMEAVDKVYRVERGALGKLVPLHPYSDDGKSIMACPRYGSGEYLYNEDGNEQNFCGQCGQVIEWR